MRGAATPAPALALVVLLLAACASGPPAGTAARPAPSPPPAGAPAQSPDETLRGVRFGAARAEVLRAYPGAACKAESCSGTTQVHGVGASFTVLAERDGRWAARLKLGDQGGRRFRALADELGLRFAHFSASIEQDGNVLRWQDKARQRHVLMRRCVPGTRCPADVAPDVVEIDFLEQGPPLARAW
jgi:hypothetical protein